MWENADYCWIVICKYPFCREGIFHGHRIVLGVTDAVEPLPLIDETFAVRCDKCGKERKYKPSDVLRYEQEAPESLETHPLFRG